MRVVDAGDLRMRSGRRCRRDENIPGIAFAAPALLRHLSRDLGISRCAVFCDRGPLRFQRRLSETRMTTSSLARSPQSQSLAAGTWFKMICGASSHDVPRIRNLSMLYAALGADCVDAAADAAVMSAVREGFAAAAALPTTPAAPWLMVSVNDDEDPHFRKATFAASTCPPACPRPCKPACPANAIDATGVLADLCYGCGRCIPVCPEGLVSAVSYVHSPASVCDLLRGADAVEIHTSPGHDEDFRRLWEAIRDVAIANLKLVAVSFPDAGSDDELERYLVMMARVLEDLPEYIELIWQTDGRPMSGDIGRGTAKASVVLGGRVCRVLEKLNLRGHVQLAGGTNDASAPFLAKANLLHVPGGVSGVAIGGHARKVRNMFSQACNEGLPSFSVPYSNLLTFVMCVVLVVVWQIVSGILDELEAKGILNLEDDEELFALALERARPLVQSIKIIEP